MEGAGNFFAAGSIPDLNFRFVIGDATGIAIEAGQRQNASVKVTALLGEAMLAAFFLSSHQNKDLRSSTGLHLEGDGPVGSILSFATSEGGLRGYTRFPEAEWSGDHSAGKGKGLLIVNRFRDGRNQVYSSRVEMSEQSVARNLEQYLIQSEQVLGFAKIQSRIENGQLKRLAGYFFESTAHATSEQSAKVFDITEQLDLEHLVTLFSEQSYQESFKTTASFYRSVKLQKTGAFTFYCDCNRSRVEKMLVALGKSEVEQVLQDEGQIEVHCEFCKKQYVFNGNEVELLFEA